jgi:DNA end-binding protein Ku
MEEKKQAGIATFVMRAKEYLVAILAENGILRAETLRFEDEVRKPEDVGLPKKAKPAPADVRKFETAIAKNTRKLNLNEFLDDYAERLEKLVAAKERKKEDIVKAPAETRESADEGGEVVDLLAVLSRSLGGTAARKPARRAPAKRSASKKRSSSKKMSSKKK